MYIIYYKYIYIYLFLPMSAKFFLKWQDRLSWQIGLRRTYVTSHPVNVIAGFPERSKQVRCVIRSWFWNVLIKTSYMFLECLFTRRQMYTICIFFSNRLTLGRGQLLARLTVQVNAREGSLCLSICDLRGSPQTRWGSQRLNLGESSTVSVYGEFLCGGIVEHVSKWA